MADGLILEKDIQAEWFLLRVGNFEKRVIPLDKNETIVGRSINIQLKNSPVVSRKHARFQKTKKGGWVIQDLESTNGTYANNVKLNSEHLYNIQESDIIGLGTSSATSEKDFLFKLCRNPNYLSQNIKIEQNISDEYLNYLKVSVNSDNYVSYSVPNESDLKDRCFCKKEKGDDAEELINQDIPDRTLQLRNCIVSLKRCDDDPNLKKVKEKISNENASYLCLSSSDSEDQDLLQTIEISRFVKARKRRILSFDDSDYDFSPNHRVKKYLSETYPKKTRELKTNIVDPIERNRTNTNLKDESAHKSYVSNIKGSSSFMDIKCKKENTDTKESFCLFDLKKESKKLEISKNIKQENLYSDVIVIDDDPSVETDTKHKTEISEFDDSVVIINEISRYSQNDDIIIISDDDSEKSIKIKEEDILIKNIKTENLADGDTFDHRCDEDSNNYFDELNSSKEEFPCDTADDYLPDLEDDSDKNVNEEELLNRIRWPLLSEDPEEEAKQNEISEEEFFPVLSQSFYSDDESTSSSSSSFENDRHLSEQKTTKITSDIIKSDKSKPNTSQSITQGNKPCGIQITEALPMQRRPKYARGREEWFMERNISEKLSTEDEFISKTSANKFYRSNLSVKNQGRFRQVKKEKKRSTLKEKLKSNMGFRLRFHGGGSAIRTTGEINDVRIISNNNQTIVSTTKKFEQNVITSSIQDCVPKNELIKEKSVMPTRIYESRSSKLIKDLLESRPSKLIKDLFLLDRVSNINVSKKKSETNITEKGNSKYKNLLKNYKIPRKTCL